MLSQSEYTEAIAKLALLNYKFIEVDAAAVMWVFERVNYRVTADVAQILRIFQGPDTTFDSAVEVLAEATKRLWFENALYDSKIDLIDAILDALGTNRSTKEVSDAFSTLIKLKFFLVPHIADIIVERARLWRDRKLGRSGIIVPGRRNSAG